ncbi:bifunctional phosphopantothenoylcysteine decarboxylase/phosphopantothenate--cysteine ligase CoaBC [Acidiphilium sp.]|uniref:bifunctional phosphopantothenoylcysteine decarboxylase/phosphopantothenate--cysteine ligase CoaBC n=1 Tax=Acidiphilium sp. TaxID=527 RepID=UPI003CFEACA7
MADLSLAGKRVLLIISGGIAAYKALELIRLLRKAGVGVRAVLTRGGAEFVTPLSVQALCEDRVYTDLFSLTDESEMGHIQLSRSADLVVVAPASADLLARMAAGLADDLATTLLLATDKPVMVAPAMNVRMWHHPATIANLATLQSRGIAIVGPEAGGMACGEFGPGRLAEPDTILAAIRQRLGHAGALSGRHAVITSGPTHEAIDPVRYIANRSSGKQGHAIAQALAQAGARVTLITGPVALPEPPGVTCIPVESAAAMHAAVIAALPADIAVFCAAVADWRVVAADRKLKKSGAPPQLTLVETPDILSDIAHRAADRPALVIGFAAETENLVANATAKRARKGCDWIIANHVGAGSDVMGGDANEVVLINQDGATPWPRASKAAIAERLVSNIIKEMT